MIPPSGPLRRSVLLPTDDFADVRPVIVVDSREQTPLTFTRLPSESNALQTGDYSLIGGEDVFAVERKSIADVVACCMGTQREVFRELHRRRGLRFKRLLIVDTREQIEAGHFRSNITPKAVLATLRAIEVRFDIPCVFSQSPESATLLVERWAYWFARELLKNASRVVGRPGA